jgi:hypothetical protein
MLNRIAAILVALGIICSLEVWWLVPWYVAVPLGLLGYLTVRYGKLFVRLLAPDDRSRRPE